MPDPSDRPSTLDYAEPGLDRRPPGAVDGATGALSAVQLALASIFLIAVVTGGSGPPPRSEPWWLKGAGWCWWATYAGGSAAALVGSLHTPPRRLRFHLPYLLAIPVGATVLTAAIVATSHGHDPDLYWQTFVITGIINPAWLLLAFRRTKWWR